jgi:hypothetical protein
MSNNYEKAFEHYQLIDSYVDKIYENSKQLVFKRRNEEGNNITNFSISKSILKNRNSNILNSIDTKQERNIRNKIEFKDYNNESKVLEYDYEDFKSQLHSLKNIKISKFLDENNDTTIKNYIKLFLEFNLDNTIVKIRDKQNIKFLISFILISEDN